ncbi:hypothetical protein [Mesorhizobium sp. M0767]|uniref:hypothetical protein n=1 Tax=Mesorhizobium sp. M0767 TaxID=2956995 RepID=UPI00333D4A68
MAYSYNDYGAKASGDTIVVGFPFQLRAHVTVKVDGVLVAANKWSWVNDGLISCLAGFPTGAGTRVLRTTPDALTGTLVGTAVLDFPTVNTNFDTLMFISQEQDDAEGERSARVGAVEDRLDDFDVDLATVAANAITSTTQAGIATTKAAEAAADRVTVAADKATVAADKATVAADKAIVIADMGTVAADKAAVAADKATVAADKATTLTYKNAADTDATNTAADRVQTGLDRTQTGADRVQTGLDRTAAAASAAAAAASAGSLAAVEVQTHGATSKATPADADEIPIADSVAAWGIKKLTWVNVKAGILAYFNSTVDAVPIDADRVWYGDSTNGFAPLYGTWTTVKAFLKTYFDTLYSALGHVHTFASLTAPPTTVAGYGITDVKFTKSFESAQQTITAVGALTIAHGLGVQPKLISVVLQCTTAELGFSINDEVFVNPGISGDANPRGGVAIVPDATNLNVRFAPSQVFNLIHKTTGVITAITPASWRFVVRAWA